MYIYGLYIACVQICIYDRYIERYTNLGQQQALAPSTSDECPAKTHIAITIIGARVDLASPTSPGPGQGKPAQHNRYHQQEVSIAPQLVKVVGIP